MELDTITISWMDGREETYPDVSTMVRDGVLHVSQYFGRQLTGQWHHPLANIRTWAPADQPGAYTRTAA